MSDILAEKRRWADMSPQQRAEETLGLKPKEQIGDRPVTEAEWARMTYDERKTYSAARSTARR